MTRDQFIALMDKLEEIRCGVAGENTQCELLEVARPLEIRHEKRSSELIDVRNLFFIALEQKTDWGRNEIKNLFTGILETFSKE